MSSIQIVPDDVGVAAAQIISHAVGNFSLHNRLNSSDLENLALEGAKEISSGLKDVASVVSKLNIPITLLLYVISIGVVVWIVLTLIEKGVIVYTYFYGNKRRRRGYGRGPCSSCCSWLKRWLTGSNSSHRFDRVVKVYPEIKSSGNGNNTGYTMELLNSRIPPPVS